MFQFVSTKIFCQKLTTSTYTEKLGRYNQSPTLDKETDHKCIGATYEKNILNQRLNLEFFDYCSCMPKIATVEP